MSKFNGDKIYIGSNTVLGSLWILMRALGSSQSRYFALGLYKAAISVRNRRIQKLHFTSLMLTATVGSLKLYST